MRTASVCSVFLFALTPVLIPVVAADDLSTSNLDTVVVTATRTEQPRALTGESMSVITAAELASAQTVAAADALARTPGLTIVRNGGVGQTTSIGMRGALTGQTLMLIDGVRINDPSAPDGSAILADLLVNNVERIEVLRGPQSTLYGSDAIGGVVNILSQRGGARPGELGASAEAGSLASYRGNIAAHGTDGAMEYGAAVNYYRTAGISAAAARDGNPEADGYRNVGATGNIRWQLGEAVSLDARGYYVDARTAFDGYPPPDYSFQDTFEYGDDRLLAAYLGLNIRSFAGRLQNRIAVTGTSSERKNLDPTLTLAEEFFATGEAQRFEYQGIVDTTSSDQLTFGAETQRTKLKTGAPSSFDPNPVPTRGATRVNGYYLQYQTTIVSQLTLTGGLRHDADSDFGAHTSLKFAAAWKLRDGATVLRANYGDGFKAPSLYQLFSEYSNPVARLAPESARGWEAGLDQRFHGDQASASLTVFERRTNDQIDFYSCYGAVSPACDVRPYGYYDNINRSRARGVELEVAAQLSAAVLVAGNITYLEAIDLASQYDLARRPRQMANLRVDWQASSKCSLGAELGYTGARFDDGYESMPLPGYALLNGHAALAITRQLQFYARVENVLDKRYQPVAGYGALPRTFAAGLRAEL
jgi:vitamin B12 transporter